MKRRECLFVEMKMKYYLFVERMKEYRFVEMMKEDPFVERNRMVLSVQKTVADLAFLQRNSKWY